MPKTIGLIAGNGHFPLLFAERASANGIPVVAVAHHGETRDELNALVDDVTWVRVGELQKIIDTFQSRDVERAVMAGGIFKAGLVDQFAPDERALNLLSKMQQWGDDSLLRGVARELEEEGIEIVESTLLLPELLTPEEVLTQREPRDEEMKDIAFGIEVAKGIGRWDVGQSVVVKSSMVLAVEAIEGTDATIQRGGRPGAIVVKVSKPEQDLRFDVPAVGPQTVAVCQETGVQVLALEAHKTLLLEREKVIAAANDADLTIIGVITGDRE